MRVSYSFNSIQWTAFLLPFPLSFSRFWNFTEAASRYLWKVTASEYALAHGLSEKVETAYQRGDLFIKRKGLMADSQKL